MTEVRDSLSDEEGRKALGLARDSLESWVRNGRKLKHETVWTGSLGESYGAFVTIHRKDCSLRGCIGHMVGDGPLGELIIELGIAAGIHDPRFEPVVESELPDLEYEISVLSPMRRTTADQVKPGVHGLLVRNAGHSGVLLPQVAQEWGWGREEFLGETCRKAGLPMDAWKDPTTEIYTFTAQIFSE